MQSTKRRLVPAALAVSIALIGSLFVSSTASAAGPYDDKTIITQGHIDLFFTSLVDGQPVLQANDDTQPGGYVPRPADDIVVHVRPSVDGRAANAFIANGVPGFTTSGDTIYVLPQNNVAGRVFAGYGYTIPAAPTTTSITYEIVDLAGPGNFATWQAGEESAIALLNPAGGKDTFTSQANHEHMAWGFTELGEYQLTMRTTVQLPGGQPMPSNEATYTFFVGEELPGDDGQDPDPDPDPDVTLSISGLSSHYHAGGVATLTADQDPVTDNDHYHWFTRAPGETAWTVVPDALGATYGFIVRTEDHGTEIIARLYDDDHGQLAESAPVTVAVDDHGNTPLEGPVVSTTLQADAGSLVISVDEGHHDVQLTDLELNAAADRYVATGEMGGIRVSDTRSDDPGWTANGRMRSFTTVDGDTLHGSNLGWSPTVLESSDGQAVSPGASVAPLLSGGPGIGAWSPMGSAETGSSRGTAVLGADLRLEAPLDLEPGTYRGLLILTVI